MAPLVQNFKEQRLRVAETVRTATLVQMEAPHLKLQDADL
jgi:hypothetical protein